MVPSSHTSSPFLQGLRKLEQSARILLNFAGAAESVGTLDDVNTRIGSNVTTEDAFANIGSVVLGDFEACVELPLLDLATQIEVGKGIDCLWAVEGGVAAISFFEFSCGTIISSGLTSVGPFVDGVGNGPVLPGGPNADSLSGSIPGADTNTVLPGTGDFADATGNVRLSGALHLSSSPNWFNCIWEINIVGDSFSCGLHDSDSSAALFLSDTVSAALLTVDATDDGPKGFAIVQFLGASTNIGGVEDANVLAGVEDITTDTALSGIALGASLGCHSLAMVDMQSKARIGTGIDCLWAVEGGVAAISYYITELGTIVNSGLTTVTPYTAGVGNGPVLGDTASPNAAAMTASLPLDRDNGNTFVAATGVFEGFEGTVRLSGSVVTGDTFYFNCIWQFTITDMPEPTSAAATVIYASSVGLAAALVFFLG